jgi:aryl-alcohol dehydrogenase-like predicted oxidoreductase
LAALGCPGYINLGHGEDYQDRRTVEEMEQRAFEVLDAAWDAGVRYFDAARSYGSGRGLSRRMAAPAGDSRGQCRGRLEMGLRDMGRPPHPLEDLDPVG